MPVQSLRLAAVAAAITVSTASLAEENVASKISMTPADTVVGLAGRWAGQGSAEFKNGKTEAFKCIVTYFPDSKATRLQQNIRCKSDHLEISLASDWSIADGSITGTWRETKYELKGTLIGNVEAGGYNLYAENEFANASITVHQDGCQQDIVMKFSKQVDLLTAALHKC